MTRAVNVAGLPGDGDAPIYSARAWVNFNGTGTVAIRAAGNVSSITDNGTGDYWVNFTTAMPDTSYSMAGSAQYPVDGYAGNSAYVSLSRQSAYTTSQTRVATEISNTRYDCSTVGLAFFR